MCLSDMSSCTTYSSHSFRGSMTVKRKRKVQLYSDDLMIPGVASFSNRSDGGMPPSYLYNYSGVSHLRGSYSSVAAAKSIAQWLRTLVTTSTDGVMLAGLVDNKSCSLRLDKIDFISMSRLRGCTIFWTGRADSTRPFVYRPMATSSRSPRPRGPLYC